MENKARSVKVVIVNNGEELSNRSMCTYTVGMVDEKEVLLQCLKDIVRQFEFSKGGFVRSEDGDIYLYSAKELQSLENFEIKVTTINH